MQKTTAADRLAPLLEWTTVDQEIEEFNAENRRDYQKRMQPSEVRRRLLAFVESFADDRVSAGKVTTRIPSEWPLLIDTSKAPFRPGLSGEELGAWKVEELRAWLFSLLDGSVNFPLSRLSFRVDRAKEKTRLLVSGPLPQVVLYLAAWLVAEHDIEIAQCEAPMADVPGRHERNWAEWPRCNGLLVAGGRGSGRQYCSDTCKRRAKNPNWKKRQKKEKRS
jgi:hypothetical protein